MASILAGKRIMVTGACGTVGRELVRQILESHQGAELIGLDNNESELFFLEQEFAGFRQAHFFLADVRDVDKLARMMKEIQIVFHAAAFKHVIVSERSPFEAVQTNIIGVQNVITAAINSQVERVIFTSSDKAVNPTSVMGTSKLMGERLISAANSNIRGNGPVLASTRFGNVLGSRGSVIPIFREQIRRGGPVTLTDPGMTRFIMSIAHAVNLVIDTAGLARGGEVFITKMPTIRIADLARVMIEELAPRYGHNPRDIKIETIGAKPGEKMYEELMSDEETRRALELTRYFVVLPAYRPAHRPAGHEYENLVAAQVSRPYNSALEQPLEKEALSGFLRENGLLSVEQER
ncbi:MAG: SDR family NAD(P)-dependent oxidoreductase [Thermodesulfobacteriota bacterium]